MTNLKAEVIIKWNDKETFQQLKAELGRRLDDAVKLLQTRIRRSLNRKVVRFYRQKRSNFGTMTTVKGRGRRTVYVRRSMPGEPPRRDTGKLWRSVRRNTNKRTLTAYVMSLDKKAPDLEFGTSRMLPRPTWRQTFIQSHRTMTKIIIGR